jgi:hypothetical protein
MALNKDERFAGMECFGFGYDGVDYEAWIPSPPVPIAYEALTLFTRNAKLNGQFAVEEKTAEGSRRLDLTEDVHPGRVYQLVKCDNIPAPVEHAYTIKRPGGDILVWKSVAPTLPRMYRDLAAKECVRAESIVVKTPAGVALTAASILLHKDTLEQPKDKLRQPLTLSFNEEKKYLARDKKWGLVCTLLTKLQADSSSAAAAAAAASSPWYMKPVEVIGGAAAFVVSLVWTPATALDAFTDDEKASALNRLGARSQSFADALNEDAATRALNDLTPAVVHATVFSGPVVVKKDKDKAK